jgi:4-hydroxy-tetrahydrodipicolinate reductase
LRLLINGAGGRMGSRLCALALADSTCRLAAAIVQENSDLCGQPIDAANRSLTYTSNWPSADTFDVVVDFTRPDALAAVIAGCNKALKPLVCGTTGLMPGDFIALRELAKIVPVVQANNFSLGVAVFIRLCRQASRLLPGEFAAHIHEAHHAHKVDAPSGTALTLGHVIAEAGESGRNATFSSVRAGEIVGDHTVSFISANEHISLTHHAVNRDVFVTGALAAAKLLCRRSPGFYSFSDLLT